MMPIGYEYGFRKKLDVVRTSEADWENSHFDLRAFICSVNDLKQEEKILQGEGTIKLITQNSDSLVLKRTSECAPGIGMLIAVNKKAEKRTPVSLNIADSANGQSYIYRIEDEKFSVSNFSNPDGMIMLKPAEIVFIKYNL
jgi:starch synthase (maltosyl-transferring)